MGVRGVLQLLILVVVTVTLTTVVIISLDICPILRPLVPMGGSKSTDLQLLVPLSQIMKGPVTIQQDDPRLIQIIREKCLYPPSNKSYNLARSEDDPSMGQSHQIRLILGEEKVRQGGFFVECGALDGETRSNTLVFEKRFGWKGILIEGDPKNVELVKKKHRKAWTVDACLSTKPYPNTVMFHQQFNIGKISKKQPGHRVAGHVEVLCLPFYSILLAVNTTTIDYFSLDVEGVELDVLKTIPWDRVDIKTLSVEFIHGPEGKSALKTYMQERGYSVYSEVTHPGKLANDFIFVKNDLMPVTEVTLT